MFFKRKKENIVIDPSEVRERLHHIAFIMDGNGRWAKRRGMPRKVGHKHGADNLRRLCKYCIGIGISTMTVYAFSTENRKRPKDEVDAIMSLLSAMIDELMRDKDENKIRCIFIGDKSMISEELRDKMTALEQATAEYPNILNVAVNYGGRDEIVHSVNELIARGASSVTEDDITAHLYTRESPELDLIVRTGGDIRISNFLLWQAAYAELYFTDTLWPDLSPAEIDRIVSVYLSRERRYGNVK